MPRYDPDEYARRLVTIEDQGVSYSDEPNYYGAWPMQLQWKQPNGTTKPLVTIEVKNGVQTPESIACRIYNGRPGSIKLD